MISWVPCRFTIQIMFNNLGAHFGACMAIRWLLPVNQFDLKVYTAWLTIPWLKMPYSKPQYYSCTKEEGERGRTSSHATTTSTVSCSKKNWTVRVLSKTAWRNYTFFKLVATMSYPISSKWIVFFNSHLWAYPVWANGCSTLTHVKTNGDQWVANELPYQNIMKSPKTTLLGMMLWAHSVNLNLLHYELASTKQNEVDTINR